MIIAVYPGTFDPFTRGHEDIVKRASNMFDNLIVGVAESFNKKPLLSLKDRLEITTDTVKQYSNVKVEVFSGLLKNFVKQHNARILLRGLRTISDFEHEFQLANMNRCLLPSIETVFLISTIQYQYISGQIIREIAQLNGDVSQFVFPIAEFYLKKQITISSRK